MKGRLLYRPSRKRRARGSTGKKEVIKESREHLSKDMEGRNRAREMERETREAEAR